MNKYTLILVVLALALVGMTANAAVDSFFDIATDVSSDATSDTRAGSSGEADPGTTLLELFNNDESEDAKDDGHVDEIDILSPSRLDDDDDDDGIDDGVEDLEVDDLDDDDSLDPARDDSEESDDEEGIEHEDIGVVDDEDDGEDGLEAKIVHLILTPDSEGASEIVGLKGGQDGFIYNGEVYLRAGFIKLGDIKGEAEDSASKGNVEVEFKVEEGESSAEKPKEIVVVGSEVRELDKASPKLQEAIAKGEVVNEDDLEKFMTQLAAVAPEEVQELVSTDNGVRVEFEQEARFLGFIPFKLRSELRVGMEPDEFGAVKVRFPWYSFLARKTVRPHDLELKVEEGLAGAQFSQWTSAGSKTGDVPTESITFNFSEIKAVFFDTAMNAIRNMK